MRKRKGLLLWIFLIVPSFAADVHEAAKTGDLQNVRALVKANPDAVNLKDGSGRTPLHWAARNDHLGVVEFLLSSGADVQAVDNLGYTALYYSVWLGRKSEITERLIGRGSNVNFKGKGVPMLFLAAQERKKEIVSMLIANGAKVNDPDIVGKTPLHIAVEGKSQEIVELLLDYGASLSTKDKLGRTPLHQSSIEGYQEITELLLAAGAAVNEKDDAGKTPLDYARKHGNGIVARLLESKGGKAEEKAEHFGFSPWLRKKLAADEAVIWYLGHAGWAVKTRSTFLIFDYWERGKSDQPLLANGRINPEEIKDLDVYVFSSHAHDDHYDDIILDWENIVGRITYVFGWPNERGKNRVCLSPREKEKTGEIEVLSVNSPEADPLDNAFLVKADGLTIYHGGDYGPLGGIERVTSIYQRDMRFLKENANDLDIMFLASRLINGQVPRYVNYSIETAGPRTLFPMHYQSSEYLFRELADEIAKSGYRTKFMPPEDRGDYAIYQGGKIKKVSLINET